MKDHIFIEGNLEELKSQLSTGKKAVYKRLINHCESYFGFDLPEIHPPKSTTYMGMAMANLSLAFILTEDEKYLVETKRWLMTCVAYPHWGNAHLVDVDLSAAWILFGMGITYDWIKEYLSSEERELVKNKIILQGDRMYDFKVTTEGSGWSTNYWQNHNWINMNGLATAGYALVTEEPKVQNWIDSAKENFEVVYSVLPDDGSDYEGVVYWRYGAMWLYIYAHLLKEREGINYFESCDFLKNSFDYRLYQSAPNLEEQMNFGDAHDTRSGHSTAIYYKTASEYNNGYAQKLGNLVRDEFLEREASLSKVKPGILPECFFEVIFFNPKVEPKEFTDLPLTKYFDDLGLFIKRSNWERNATLFTYKCSNPGGKKQWDLLWKMKEEKNYDCFGLSHQHPDNNSFLINTQGEYLAIDDGYNRHVKASDHNVVLVDGVGYEDEGQNNIWKNYTKKMVAEVENCIITEDVSYIVGETANVYKKSLNLKSFKRHVINIEKPYYVLLDELDSDDKHIYTWQMYSKVFPTIDGNKFSYQVGDAKSELYLFSNVKTESELKENVVKAVMTTQEPDKFTENHMKGLCFRNIEKTEKLNFLSVIIPENNNNKYLVKDFKEDGIYGVTVEYGDCKDTYIYSEKSSGNYNNIVIDSKITVISYSKNLVEKLIKL